MRNGSNPEVVVSPPTGGPPQQKSQMSETPSQNRVEGGLSWAAAAATEPAIGRDQANSESDKRKYDHFRAPGRQRNRKVEVGKNTIIVDEGGEAAPLEFNVGNTTPKATPEIIKAVISKCAAQLGKEVQVLDVKCLTNGFDNPRTKSWKVKVPYKYKWLMERNDLYPEGWTYRKFFAP